MFTGWTNQVSSWMGGIKPGQGEEATGEAQNQEEKGEAVTTTPEATGKLCSSVLVLI